MKLYSSISRALLLLLLSSLPVSAQTDTAGNGIAINTGTSAVDYTKLAVLSAVTAGGFVYGHLLQEDIWWKGEKSSFHFEWNNDWNYALGADKFGHFYFPYVVTNIYSRAFEWTGIDRRRSLYYASALAFSYQTYIEIRDGYSKQWGFSWGDFAANTLGALYPLLQHEYPLLKNFTFKISYYPSPRFKQGSHTTIIDDYESTTHWLSINVHNLLPAHLRSYYPSFINIALGHSVKALDTPYSYHELYLSLDLNLEALPGSHWLLRMLKENLNYYHLPSPAIKISPGFVSFGLKF